MKREKVVENTPQGNFSKIAVVAVVAIIIIFAGAYAINRYSRNKEISEPTTKGIQTINPVAPANKLTFTADTTVPFNTKKGNVYPYSFSYPSTLPLVVFTGDLSDSVAIDWGGIPPQQNVLFNIELIEKRDPELVKQSKEDYVKNWYKFFTGLKGIASFQPFTNTGGLKGYKAQYVNWANQTPNIDVFFEIPNRAEIMMHLANGILDYTIFDRIVDSVRWEEPSPTPLH